MTLRNEAEVADPAVAALPVEALTPLRRELHALAERSHGEVRTARRVTAELSRHRPDALHQDLAGHGVLAWWAGPAAGPTVLLRAELDALPIPETLALPHGSATPGTAHKCGHDGHMAILCGLAAWLGAHPPAKGRVALLFQPAEETGEGAARLLAEPVLQGLAPDWAFALHNLPGYPAGQIVVREGAFAAASTGLAVTLIGHTAHAAEPARGRSPALALAQLISAWSALPQDTAALHESAKATVIHARLGSPAFGTTPGEAEAMVTLRAYEPAVLDTLREAAVARARALAATYGLDCQVREVEPFPATWNDPRAARAVQDAAAQLGLEVHLPAQPFPWSEDFGHLTATWPGALFGLGAGLAQPALHHPGYDFPDGLLPVGVAMFAALLAPLVGTPAPPAPPAPARETAPPAPARTAGPAAPEEP